MLNPEIRDMGRAIGGASAADAERIFAEGVPERVVSMLEEAVQQFEGEVERDLVIGLLDAGRHPVFLRRIYGTPTADRWLQAVLAAIDAIDLNLKDLLRLRVRQDPGAPLFRVPAGNIVHDFTRTEILEKVEAIAAGLSGILPDPVEGDPITRPERVSVAILSPNRIETILVDLACLTHGLIDVPIPAEATPEQVGFILNQTQAAVLVVSDVRRLEQVLAGGPLPSTVRSIVLMSEPDAGSAGRSSLAGTRTLSQIEQAGRIAAGGPDLSSAPPEESGAPPRAARPQAPCARPRVRDLATIMFTSGTTGNPKGIRFSQRNILFKRFCRAVAIPEIGGDDVFLCYLPLFHTFGRWLEMTGTIFWGAQYVLMENPSAEAMLDAMRRFRPSVFISIPKRWIQLREKAFAVADASVESPDDVDPKRLAEAVAEVTGGRLSFGLSAAGYLDADVFLFFHRHGIQLLSGFGMTEATGGITMTPPHHYKRGTVGVALPGVEARRGEDGELLVRGPYMMLGYDDPGGPVHDYEKEWFGTGDLVQEDTDGYFTIIDRKKDIYKNVKGQTISPQRIENMFTEFEEIKRVFLVGDGKEYNTLLIYPNYEASAGKLARMAPADLRDYLSSYVVSVNRFLSSYERIVDFDLLPRFFREERGELTAKGTFVRKVVERSFQDLIDSLYARSYVSLPVGGIEVRVPNWLLREKGLTADALYADPGAIRLQPTGDRLVITRIAGTQNRFRIGTYTYAIDPADARGGQTTIDLDPILRIPRHWVGNVELVHFAGEELLRRPRRVVEPAGRIQAEGWQRPVLLQDLVRDRFAAAIGQDVRGPAGVHDAAALVLCARGEAAAGALEVLEGFLADPTSEEAALALGFVPLLRFHGDAAIRRRALVLRVERDRGAGAGDILRRFLATDPEILDDEIRRLILECDLGLEAIRSIFDLACDLEIGTDPWALGAGRSRVRSVLRLAADIGIRWPARYEEARHALVRRSIDETDPEIRADARRERDRLGAGFRGWIATEPMGPIDPLTGDPMPWERIVGFDERIPAREQEIILRSLEESTLLRETCFLIGEDCLISRQDLQPGGIWVSDASQPETTGAPEDDGPACGIGRRAVRMTVRTPDGRRFEFVVRFAGDAGPDETADQIDWMIRMGAVEHDRKLVASIGGYWSEYGIWTEEYVHDEPVLSSLRRLSAATGPEAAERLKSVWVHYAWSALTAVYDYWQRTGRKQVLVHPGPDSIAVAPHDYQEGSRILRIAPRIPFPGIARMLRGSYEDFVTRTEAAYPVLQGFLSPRIAILALIEALGEADAIPILWRSLHEIREAWRETQDPAWRVWQDALLPAIDEIEKDGHAPRRVVMAARRYHTWERLNPGTSMQTRAEMLQEMYETYGLPALEESRPETRVRFFRMTVFASARGPLAAELDALMRTHRDAPLSLEGLLRRMTILHTTMPLSEDESYFLARMTYSHLRPAQRVHIELLEEGGETRAELVEEIRDEDGAPLVIRAAANPKEVMRLHHLFEGAGLDVLFRPEHSFLLALDGDATVAAGLFFRPAGHGRVHMEKIVVAPRHRGKGVGEKLMGSFLQRMRDDGMATVTTGFFRPHYFYRFGFRLEKGFAGLVCDLSAIPASPERVAE
jgi:long-chain acyl-CoA synthetase